MWIFHVQAGQLNFEILTGQYTQIRHYSLRGSTTHKKRPFNINTKHINIYPALFLFGQVHCTDCINFILHRCSLFEWKWIYRVFIYRLFIHVSVLPFGIQLLRGVEIRLDGSTLPHFCACPKPGPGLPTSYVVVFVVLNDLRWEVIIHFVDIGGIADHHCLNFHFMRHINLLWPVNVRCLIWPCLLCNKWSVISQFGPFLIRYLSPGLYQEKHDGYYYWGMNCQPFRVHAWFVVGSVLPNL
jgi:hypothetical protein